MAFTNKNVDDSENNDDIDETPFHNDSSMLHLSSLPTTEDSTYEVEHTRLKENNMEETPFMITPDLTKQPIEENPKETVRVEKKRETAVPFPPEQYNLNISVQDLPLSARSRNGLCRGGIMTLRQLLQYDKESLLGVRNLGKYSIKEIKTISGYILNDKEYIVEFKKDNGNFEKTIYSHTKEFENKITKTEITKSDIVTGETIEGAELSIIDKETGKIIAAWISTSDSQKIYGLTSGKTYILKENLAPVGYQIAEDVEFTIQPSGEIQKVEMKDKPDYKSVRVIKIDSKTKEPIKTQDVEFTLYEDEECTIPLMTVTTNEEGYATFDKLTYGFANNKEGQSGVFYIKETKAPKGYRLSKEVVEIEIDNNTESDSYIIEYQNHILP